MMIGGKRWVKYCEGLDRTSATGEYFVDEEMNRAVAQRPLRLAETQNATQGGMNEGKQMQIEFTNIAFTMTWMKT